jgi:hypothetical protein
MKIDRFVKVILVLIAVLLALNCAKAFGNSSDTHGNSNSSAGSSRTPILESTVEAAAEPSALQVGKTQYKAVAAMVDALNDANGVQRTLDQQSAQGWEYVGSVGVVLIFKK